MCVCVSRERDRETERQRVRKGETESERVLGCTHTHIVVDGLVDRDVRVERGLLLAQKGLCKALHLVLLPVHENHM